MAEALLPALLRRIDRLTAGLRGVSGPLGASGVGPRAAAAAPALADLLARLPESASGPAPSVPGAAGVPLREPRRGSDPDRLERTGWCLGALATLGGSDLLLARRAAWGPAALAELALEALGVRPPSGGPAGAGGGAREAVGEEAGAAWFASTLWSSGVGAGPRGQGLELALLVVDLVVAAVAPGAPLPPPPRLTPAPGGRTCIRLVRSGAPPRVRGVGLPRAAPDVVRELVPGALRRDGDAACELHLPDGWLEPRATAVPMD